MNTDDLIFKAQNNDEEAINDLIKFYLPLVSINVKNFFLIGADREDLIQEGLLGLFKAIKYYKSEKSSFNTFAILCIRRQIFSAIKLANSNKNMALNEAILNSSNISEECDTQSNLEFITDESSPEYIFFNKDKFINFKKYADRKFSKLEKQVLEYLIRGYSYKEIAKQLDKNLKSIDNTIQRIKKKSEIWINEYNMN
ncbi:sigma-70 family RNA polymerase sigma factor [Fusobacterium russii]|uniref:sigma-70 family RNA polymerase sigma factor n=1 Tax=Fusobacterium russii TaxID=854 RepID=UPI0003A479EB|nr:sigma-70 family RNA polymerase sigma factor [Fusobacterium russii]